MQAAAERQLREQGQLPSAAAADADTAGTGDAAADVPAANGDAAPEGDAAAAGGAGGGPKKGKASAKDKEEALLKAKRKEIMERAGKLCCTSWAMQHTTVAGEGQSGSMRGTAHTKGLFQLQGM